MSPPFAVFAALDVIVVIGFAVWLKRTFDSSLPSVEEKNRGMISFYRDHIGRALRLDINQTSVFSFLHYVALHLFIPFVGLGLFLHSDANFLVIIGAVLASMQLFQRVYPARPEGIPS